MKKNNKIVVTGGSGRFGTVLKRSKFNYRLFFPKKNQLNILEFNSIKRYLSKIRPFCIIHLAGFNIENLWTKKNKDIMFSSRVHTSKLLYSECCKLNLKIYKRPSKD